MRWHKLYINNIWSDYWNVGLSEWKKNAKWKAYLENTSPRKHLSEGNAHSTAGSDVSIDQVKQRLFLVCDYIQIDSINGR